MITAISKITEYPLNILKFTWVGYFSSSNHTKKPLIPFYWFGYDFVIMNYEIYITRDSSIIWPWNIIN